jgi:hypothetical protein
MSIFKSGDIVAIFGSVEEDRKSTIGNIVVCNVIESGKSDLIVEHVGTGAFSKSSYYIVPKSICQHLSMEKDMILKSTILAPKIGDLVLSFNKKSYSDEETKFNGILMKVSYRLGKPDIATVMVGTESLEASYSSLMVLERNSSKP